MWESANEALHQATHRVVLGVANFLPGVIALIVAIVVAAAVAWLLGAVLRRSLRSVDFDARIDHWGFSAIADWSPSRSPTLLVSKAARWITVLVGILVGLTALEADLTSRLVYNLFSYLPDALAALLLVVIGTLAARFLARSALISAVNMNLQSARLISVGVKWLVLVLTTAMALGHLRIGGDIVRSAFLILFGGIVLALALAVGLGSKDMVSRTLEKQSRDQAHEDEETFHHL